MKVLMITGDKNMLSPGSSAYERAQLQRSVVDELKIVYWGRGSLAIPSARGFDVVTVQDPFWRGLAAWISARLGGAKLQVQVHTDFIKETATSLVRHVLGQIMMAHADSIRVVSQKVKSQIERYTKAPISVLPIYVDIEKIHSAIPADLKQQFPQFNKIILCVSRLEPEKNVAATIELLPNILKEFPQAGLLIAGSGSQMHFLELLAKKLSVETNVIFLGWRNDLPSFYKSADVLVVTSVYESFAAGAIEALAAGCAVVAPDVGLAREAGAEIVEREEIGSTVAKVLRSGTKGTLTMKFFTKEEWAHEWLKTL